MKKNLKSIILMGILNGIISFIDLYIMLVLAFQNMSLYDGYKPAPIWESIAIFCGLALPFAIIVVFCVKQYKKSKQTNQNYNICTQIVLGHICLIVSIFTLVLIYFAIFWFVQLFLY